MKLKIVCDDPKYLPAYANNTDSCMDIKIKIQEVIEIDNEQTITTTKFIKPNETMVFDTGIKVAIPDDYIMMIFPRSSTGIKLNCRLANSTGIIDSGYRDEIKIALTNFGKNSVIIADGQRVAQFVILPRPKIELVEVDDNADFRIGDRQGGIGSTGK